MVPPPVPKRKLIVEQWAHMDWDWVGTFAQNYWYYTASFCGGADDIIRTNIEMVRDDLNHYYSICEMAFLRRFVENHPGWVESLLQQPSTLGDRFQVVGGGDVSPDCLVSSGEGFIRNYLVGQTWLYKTLGMKAKPHCWIPDDFGQGPEVPVLLKALGFTSVAFARLPGMDAQPGPATGLKTILFEDGLAFNWEAADKSTIIGHWMGKRYDTRPGFEESKENFINDFLETCYSSKTASVMYIPISYDFMMPSNDLDTVVTKWTEDNTDVQLQQGTYDQYISALEPHSKALKTRRYNGTPYWTGHYASRPELKILHNETVRLLVGAEIIALLVQSYSAVKSMLPPNFWTRVSQAWTDYVPSTHHDYVCGTASDAVYTGEQLPLLRGVAATARMLRAIALSALGSMTAVPPDQGVLIANSLGFERTGVAVIEDTKCFVEPSEVLSWPDATTSQVQPTAEGGMLVYATVPSFGYTTGTKGPSPQGTTNDSAGVILTPLTDGSDSYTLENEFLCAKITEQAQWGISSLLDKQTGSEVLAVSTGESNAIIFYDDPGDDLYCFSNEFSKELLPIPNVKVTTNGAGLGAVVLEEGPLRIRLRTEVLYEFQRLEVDSKLIKLRFMREYELRKGEPFLRMTTTGAAPDKTSVMTRFSLARNVDSMTHGTGYHWTSVAPSTGYYPGPLFRPTHDFIIPYDKTDVALGAIYHSAMPAWTIDQKDNLIGCLLRNAGGANNWGAVGGDAATHTQRYAIRVPFPPTYANEGESPREALAKTGQPLREALGFHTELMGVRLTDSTNYRPLGAPSTRSIASVSTTASTAVVNQDSAILTVAKPGSYDEKQLILRLYQPTNAPVSVDVTIWSNPSTVKCITATEQDLDVGQDGQGGTGNDTKINGQTVTLSMENSIATVSVGGVL